MNRKTAFALLTDPAYAGWFTPEQRSVIAAHVPFTRRVCPGPVRWGGREVDLVELALSERARFVLKPSNAYGGSGVRLGAETPPAEWERAVRAACAGQAVLQERRKAGRVRLPAFADGAVEEEELYFDVCPFLFGGRGEGAMVRLSTTPLSNVCAGASVSSLCVADDAAREVHDV